MSKISLTNLVNLQNETTAVNAINANNAVLTTALDNTLSRDGTSPNTMSANLDMNSHRILNLPIPVNQSEPLRLADVSTVTAFQNGVSLAAALAAGAASASAAATSATNSATSATASATSATSSATSATNAAASAASILGSSLMFDTVADYTAATITLANNSVVYIKNYYSAEQGGGHWCVISSTTPSHGAYHTSANGKFAALYEQSPTFKMFGARPYGVTADCTPYLDLWQDYCDAFTTRASTLYIEAGTWTFTTPPRPFFTSSLPWGRTVTGAGVQNTFLYTNYSNSAHLGFFHLLPNSSGGGMTIKDLQIISQKTDFSNGSAIAAHDGNVDKLVIDGTTNTGDILSVTIAGTTVTYTVPVGATKNIIAVGVALAINVNSTIFNAYNMAIPWKDTVVVLSKASAPPVITVGTTGTTTITKTAVGAQTSGYIYISNVNITAANGWSYSALFDGQREDVAPLGVRSIFCDNCNFFGADVASVSLKGVDNVHFANCGTFQAGGTVGTLQITGIASGSKTQNFSWIGGAIQDINMDWAYAGVIIAGIINGNVVNTANTDRMKIVAGRIGGTASALWTNSAYL